MSSHAPFPDVTGLRTSGPGWSRIGDDCEYIDAVFHTELDVEQLASSSPSRRPADLIWAAWATVLYHYGSHEASNVEIVDLGSDSKQSDTLVTLDFEGPSADESLDPAALLELVGDRRREAVSLAGGLEHGYAAAALPADETIATARGPPPTFSSLRLESNRALSLILTAYSHENQGTHRLSLSMKASPAVHTSDSAALQLQQVASLVSSFLRDVETHALSVERFDLALRASDNLHYVELPEPDYLADRHHDRLECEFEYFADTRPNDLALDFRFDLQDRQSVKWTYAEMNARADRVRNLLWSHGIGSASTDADAGGDQIVALYLEKSPETYLSFLSVVKAGAAWCPIDTDWPASRRQALLAKSNAKVVLVAGDAVSRNLDEDLNSDDLRNRGMHPIRLDKIVVVDQANGVAPRPLQPRSREQLAYMIWTSGTTGLPKGVGIQHWAIVQAMRALRLKIPYGKAATGTDEVRYLQYSAYNFDLSIMDCFYAWGIGGTICACPRGLLLQDLVAVGTSFRPTHTLLTPAVMAMTERHAIPSLKVVINGGEKLSQVVADEWSKECCLLNLYGPAEATLIAMNRRVPLGDRVKAPNIGVALPTVSCHALDKADRVVLKGAVGELVLGGPQLARGYVGDPVKTADKFFPHAQLGRVYRTGDLVRQLGNAEFEYLGRIDDQVKINGIRIELLEINAAIKNSHEAVKDSETMAFPRPGSDTELQIINFSVFPREAGADGDELLRTDPPAVAVARDLQKAAKESLPSYMLPSMFVILSRFPRTSSAKIDRVALKQVLANFDSLDWENKLAEADGGPDADAPPSEAEECMRKWLAKLCNVAPEKIGRNTPFTSVGLDSIRAITFSQKLLQEGYTVSVVDVAEYPTLISLSRQLDSSASQAEAKEARAADFFGRFDSHFRQAVLDRLSVSSADVGAVLPCTPLQEGMLVESQQDPMAYRIQRQYRVSGKLDRRRLESALGRLIDEADILRASFIETGALDVEAGSDWPSPPIFVQVVWSRGSAEIYDLDLGAGDDLEGAVTATVRDRVKLSPFGKRAPVAFLIVRQAEQISLVLVAHHSVYDARSLAILEDRIERLYAQEQDLPRIYQFPTALSHILPLDSDEEAARRTAWEKALATYPRGELSIFPNLSGSLPQAGSAPDSVHRTAGQKASVSWSEVEQVSRKLGISARPLVQVAWAKVLGAYLDTDHLIIGDSVSGRSSAAELEQVVGPVLSTLPVPVFLDSQHSVAEVARQVDAFHRSVFAAQHTHLGSIRKLLEVPAGQQLFHSVFVFEPATETQHSTMGQDGMALGLERVADLAVATEHALGVEVQPNADGSIRLGVSWRRALVSDAYGRLLLKQFDACLAAICASPEATIRDCFSFREVADDGIVAISAIDSPPSIAVAGLENVGHAVSVSAKDSSTNKTNAVEIFSEIPEARAGRRASAAMTYAELEEASSRVAAYLASLDLPRNAVVAVCLQRSLASYIYPIGVLKAGFAYLPLDETLPLDRKKLLLEDSSAACLIADRPEDLDRGSTANLVVVSVNSEEHRSRLSAVSPRSPLPQSLGAGPDDVAFIIYTSGSTGKPKGCLLTHRNLSTAIEAFRLVYEREAPGSFASGARFLARSAEAFDVHLLEIFLSLRVGATIVTGPRHVIHDDLAQTMSMLEVTHACVVPSLFFSRGQRIRPEQVPSLRALIIGGEALTADLCQLWGSFGSERPVVLNAYGPSEATIGTSIARVSKRSVTGNIGTPFPGTRYLVLKTAGDMLVPALRGEPGELCVAGPQVARGYLNRPDLHSFLRWEDEWIYRTGDLVRLNAADEAEYLGRIDGSQVKVRGARLELGEVDAALQKALAGTTGRPAMAVTLLAEHPQIAGPARLVSFVSDTAQRADTANIGANDLVRLDQRSKELAHTLRRAVRSKLPQYMVPSQVVPLAYLPLSTLSGKADQKALRTLYQSVDPRSLGVSDATEQGRDATEDEKRIADIVSSTLRLGKDITLSPSTDLISIGLDSLSVVTLAGRLRKAGISVTATAIMSDPTIESIASQSQAGGVDATGQSSRFEADVQARTEKARSLPSMSGKGIEKALPCVPLQTALVAQARSESASTPRYMTTVSIDIQGTFPPQQVQQAWREVLQRHDIYRTVFVDIDEELSQVVLDASSCPDVWYAQIGSNPSPSELHSHHQRTAREIVDSFSERPPLRLKLWHGDHDSQQISLTCSHAIYDGTSLNQLLREVASCLRSEEFPNSGQFIDAVREIVGQPIDAGKRFWTAQLEGFSRTAMPRLTGKKVSASEPAGSGELTVQSSHRYSELEAVARSRGVTVHSLLLASYGKLLAEYVGEDDVTIGLVLGGRTLNVDNIDLIHGPCVTTVPFRFRQARRHDVDALSRFTHRGINDVLPFQHVSLPQLMRWIGMDQSPFEALFSYLGARSETASSVPFVERSTIMEKDYPLAVEVGAVGDKVSLHVAFSTQTMPQEHAALFLEQLDHVIGGVLAASSPPSADEKHLSILNRECYVPSSDSETFLARFAAQAAGTPRAIAIVFAKSLEAEAVALTYEQLDTMSDTIARHLIQQSSDVIGVHLTKDGPELYAAMLAVWKAGKVYLPLDPSLPRDRLEYMLETVGKAPAITNMATRATLDDFDSESLDIQDLLRPADPSASLPKPSLEAACYLLFTSGSTGRPKAVQIGHKALSGAIYSWERMLPWSKQSRFLQLASIGFDVSLIEVCMPLALGFSIGTAPKEALIEDLTTAIHRLGITIADLPAALAGTVHPDDVELEWLMSGGDAIDERVIHDWTSAGRVLINAWGPTETTIGSSLGQVKRGGSRSNVGQVYPACSMFVLKGDSVEPVLRGAIGELAVGGPQVADKYFGRDDLTAEKFVYLADGTRVYRTGDLGRFLIDGSVECLGRIGADRQVKVNGQRVELDEISQALSMHVDVRDADVQYLKHPEMSSKQLVAFVAPHQTARSTGPDIALREDAAAVELVSKLEQEATKRLAPYMIPTQWLVVDGNLPLTPNNKVDHKALAALFASTDTSMLSRFGAMREEALSHGAWTAVEEELRDLIADFCDVPVANMTKTTCYRVSVSDILSSPFIGSLAERHGEATDGVASTVDTAGDLRRHIETKASVSDWQLSSRDEIISALPCTPLQAGMITQTLASGGKLYFHHHAFRARATPPTAVVAAWKTLASRLDILRTTFHSIEDERPWVQAVHANCEPCVFQHAGRFDHAAALEEVEGQAVFGDVQAFAEPPHALHLWADGEGCAFVLGIHHALYDAASLPLLFRDLASLLSGSESQALERAPFYQLVPRLLPTDQDTQHWSNELRDLRAGLLRNSKKQDVADGHAVEAEHVVSLPIKAIQQSCQRSGVTIQVLATLAYAKLLALETGSADVCFGQIFGLRDGADNGETSVGPALNTVATRVRFDDRERSVAEQLQRMQKANDAGRPHRKASLRDVQQAAARSGVRAPLFDALFDFQIMGEDNDDSGSPEPLQPVAIGVDDGPPQYALNVEFVQGAERMTLVSTADSSVYSEKALAAALDRLEKILVHLVEERSEVSITQLPFDDLEFPTAASVGPNGGLEREQAAGEARLPETADGKRLAEVIAQVAGVSVDKIHSSMRLSSLGLDSISAIRIASLARRQGLVLGVADIVSAETVEGIVDLVSSKAEQRKKAGASAGQTAVSAAVHQAALAQLDLRADAIERILPLLSGQAVLAAGWLESGKRFGVYSFTFRAPQRLDSKRLNEAWTKLQQRHAILRTAFLAVQRKPYQVVLKSGQECAAVREEAVDSSRLEEAAMDAIRAANAAPWDLRTPPIRLTHISSAAASDNDGGSVVVLSLHHLLYDAFSLDLLVRDLQALYAGSDCPSTSNWADYVDHLSATTSSEASARFWRQSLQHADAAVLPSTSKDEAGKAEADEIFTFHPAILQDFIRYEQRLRARQTSLQALFIAAWSRLLSSWTGKASPLFAVFQLGRSASFDGIERLAAPLMSILPMALEPSPSADRPSGSVADLVESSRDVAHQLRRRAEFEQTDLADIARAAGWGTEEARWNTYINVLIPPSPSPSSSEQDVEGWQEVKLGQPTDFVPPKPLQYASTLDAIEHAPLVRSDVAVDVALDPATDSVTVGIRAKKSILDADRAAEVARQLARDVREALEQLD
ncbi:related to Ferrichrome siderophore peptide synthetase [Pseudozyma flocculosa]|uniref:Related to Ferrichrome siderophore peptide synthetase n=1 Tax=Pseudozyma flocculosa TaxID=84751 RepID=A0A5C3F244_9BASI|nr:related to Ferrichrome siderophore peptide synthetase [Pseudozyma flocculosa]